MSVNKKKIFYETIKIEILAGQYLIDNMQIKLTKALAKNLLDQEQYDELIILADEKVDKNFKESVTLEMLKENLLDMQLDIFNIATAVSDLTESMFEGLEDINETDDN